MRGLECGRLSLGERYINALKKGYKGSFESFCIERFGYYVSDYKRIE